MPVNSRNEEIAVDLAYGGGHFETVWNSGETTLHLTTPLRLDRSSENYSFSVAALSKVQLKESSVREVFLRGENETRVGWLIPANALSSIDHDFVENIHFLRYAFVTLRDVLNTKPGWYRSSAAEALARGVVNLPFSDLFDDSVCFLVVCTDLVDGKYEFDRLLPGLISNGYVPMTSDPSSLEWTGTATEPDSSKLKLQAIGSGITHPQIPARLMSTAAVSSGSLVTQFFYLYQVVEFLLEEVLYDVLPSIGKGIVAAIDDERYSGLRDQLEALNTQLSERARLKLLMKSFVGSDKAFGRLEAASLDFLEKVNIAPKPGIDSLYQVRNFIIHQVRNMPSNAEEPLRQVTIELASFLAEVLASFKRHASEQPPS